jgi:hypothetical protein
LITTDFCRDRVVVMVILAHWLMRRRVADRRWTWISRRAQVTVRIGDDTASIANLIDVGVARTAREPFFSLRHLYAGDTSAPTPQLKTTGRCTPFARIAILFFG